jgi:hypothetical protein
MKNLNNYRNEFKEKYKLLCFMKHAEVCGKYLMKKENNQSENMKISCVEIYRNGVFKMFIKGKIL